MKILAYTYRDPLIDSAVAELDWGWDVERVYADVGGRQALHQLLKECQDDPPEYLLVRRLAELGDSVDDVGDRLQFLEALGVQLIAIQEPIAAGDQPVCRADVFRLFKTMQATQTSRRIQRSHAQNRLNALPPPGKAPYGYRRGKDRYTLDRSTAPVVKDFFDHFLLYGSLRGSVRYLQKKYSKTISVSTGKRWLTSSVYRGDLTYRDGATLSDTHVPIISRQEAAQIDRLLRRNRLLPPRTASASRSLAGLVTCAACQSPMTVTSVTAPRRSHDYLYLRPTACPQRPKCRAISYEAVLDKTIQRICVDLPAAVDGTSLPDLDRVKAGVAAQVAEKQRILEQLPSLVDTHVLDPETAQLRAYKLRAEIAQIQANAAQLPPVNLKAVVQTVSIQQFWLDLSEAERRFYFREFIRQIQLIRHEAEWDLRLIFMF